MHVSCMKVNKMSKLFLFVITTKSDIPYMKKKASYERLFANEQKSGKHNCTHGILWARDVFIVLSFTLFVCISEARC